MAQVETLGMAEIAMRQAHLTTLMDIRALLTLEQREEIERCKTKEQERLRLKRHGSILDAVLDKAKGWAALTDEQTQEFNTAYAAVTGG